MHICTDQRGVFGERNCSALPARALLPMASSETCVHSDGAPLDTLSRSVHLSWGKLQYLHIYMYIYIYIYIPRAKSKSYVCTGTPGRARGWISRTCRMRGGGLRSERVQDHTHASGLVEDENARAHRRINAVDAYSGRKRMRTNGTDTRANPCLSCRIANPSISTSLRLKCCFKET